LPSGLTNTIQRSKDVLLDNPYIPTSITTYNETSIVAGKIYTRSYDPISKVWTSTTPEGRLSSITNNELGDPRVISLDGIADISIEYDDFGRQTRVTSGSGDTARQTHFEYYTSGSSNGYLRSITDALGQKTEFEYNANGWNTSTKRPDGEMYSKQYDPNGNLTSITAPNSQEHTFSYTPLDDRESYLAPALGNVESTSTNYTYDLRGDLQSTVRADGRDIQVKYGAMTGSVDRVMTPNVDYEFNRNSVGQLDSISSTTGDSLSFTYDGPLVTTVTSAGDVSGQISYGYNSDFNVDEICINLSSCITNVYDDDQLFVESSVNGEGFIYARDQQKGGLINRIMTSSGTVLTEYAYNEFGEIESANHSELMLSYERDKLGRIVSKSEIAQGQSVTTKYAYDLAGRLSQVEENGLLINSWQYDANGNRTHENGVLIGEYDSQDRLVSYAGTVYEYSANGELLSRTLPDGSLTTYDYDVFGNLLEVNSDDGRKIEYLVDAQQRRVGKRIDGNLVQGFLYQDQLNPIAELDSSGNVLSQFIYGEKQNVPDILIREGVPYRIISDHLGSPRLVVDIDSGIVAQRMNYDAWGNVIQDTNPGFQPFGFAGGIYDADTDLVRFGARDYDAVTGRWTAKDPIDFGGNALNLYGYSRLDPINYVDSNGRNPVAIAAGFAGGLYSGISNFRETKSYSAAIAAGVAGAITSALNPSKFVTSFAVNAANALAQKLLSCEGGLGGPDVIGSALASTAASEYLPISGARNLNSIAKDSFATVTGNVIGLIGGIAGDAVGGTISP